MPNLTVQEAREAVFRRMHGSFIPDSDEWVKNRDAIDALLAAHDAEGVAGDWSVKEGGASGNWWLIPPGFQPDIWCRDEATARAYARALNRADHSLKEGT